MHNHAKIQTFLLLFLYLIQHVFCPVNDSTCFVAIRYKPCAIYQIKADYSNMFLLLSDLCM
jgi:hypothetical protein